MEPNVLTMYIQPCEIGDPPPVAIVMKHPASKPVATTINIRVSQDAKDLIDRAAAAVGKTRTDFMLDAALASAREAVLDQAFIQVSDEQFQSFKEILDRPLSENAALQSLLSKKAPWEN